MCKARLTSYNMSLPKEMGQPDYTGIITCMQQQKVLCPLGLGILFWPFHEVSCAPCCAPCWHNDTFVVDVVRVVAAEQDTFPMTSEVKKMADGVEAWWCGQCKRLIWASGHKGRQRQSHQGGDGHTPPSFVYPPWGSIDMDGVDMGAVTATVGTVLAHTPPLFPITHALVHETKGWNERDR